MPTANDPPLPQEEHLRIPLPDVIRFVRQLSHDLRNHLNAVELQSAYLKEIADDPECKDEIQRLRGMFSEMGGSLQRLTTAVAPVKLTEMPYDAATFLEDLQFKISSDVPETTGVVDWKMDVGSTTLMIDPQLLQQVFLELFTNAIQHGRGAGALQARAKIENRELIFELHEPKTAFSGSVQNWGREPFRKVGQGHYGLGLHRARSIIEAHQGRLEVRHDPVSSTLVTTVALPSGARA